ncbi:MAG: 4-hydroxyphenylacetate 3-hydroxylase family protein, partial [Dehalococcoidia bacterium]
MPARTGADYLASLSSLRPDLWLGGRRVENVATHPAFAGTARTLAGLYDLQHNLAERAVMLYPSPTTGDPVGASFMEPHGAEDIDRRHRTIARWAVATCGMMGRSPDFLNTQLMAHAAGAELFGRGGQRYADNVRSYYEHVREHDLCLTHTLLNPQIDRSKPASAQAEEFLAMGVVRETSDGLIVRGARMLATLAPFSEELAVFPSTVLTGAPGDVKHALAFAIPCDTPGLRFICRDSFSGEESPRDHPLGSRFEEMDAFAVFDDVLVPWERLFINQNVELANAMFTGANVGPHLVHQFCVKMIAKAEFVLGLAVLLVETINVGEFLHVQEKLGEIVSYVETMKACVRAAEADLTIHANGVAYPAMPPLATARNLFPKFYPRMIEILQLLGAS